MRVYALYEIVEILHTRPSYNKHFKRTAERHRRRSRTHRADERKVVITYGVFDGEYGDRQNSNSNHVLFSHTYFVSTCEATPATRVVCVLRKMRIYFYNHFLEKIHL